MEDCMVAPEERAGADDDEDRIDADEERILVLG